MLILANIDRAYYKTLKRFKEEGVGLGKESNAILNGTILSDQAENDFNAAIAIHSVEEAPYLEVPVYDEKVSEENNWCDNNVIVFYHIRNSKALYADTLTVEVKYDEKRDKYQTTWHKEELSITQNGMATPEEIELVGWCELPINCAKQILL